MTDKVSPRAWGTAVSKDRSSGHAVIFRYASETFDDSTRLSQPNLIRLIWQYEGEAGMPHSETRQRMDALEDAIALAVEADGFASLVLVSTGEYRREWTYYVGPTTEFMNRLNRGLADHPRYPIEIRIGEDPEWEKFEEFKRSVAG
ncbi:DUF695 domain-containing protein [Paraburkholderia hospita]|uniref:DUF695 domain-containing protein n=1 Tax=Paraburkholderia hospita TaxID=169430 RepID=UPI0009D3F25E|nr:DUF695 domain-containing protein [Paraburkholderia hospita]SKC69765.1 Family of unknown function [Paraburkholderia hospita]